MKKEHTPTNEELNIAYEQSLMEKEEIIDRLRQGGYRITRQRVALLDVILNHECSCCKEIYFRVHKKMPRIGVATIYRMINTLEEIGAIRRKNLYRICTHESFSVEDCVVELSGGERLCLSRENFYHVMEEGIKGLGLSEDNKIQQVVAVNTN